MQEKQLTTKDKEQYLKGRRSRTIQQSIDKCKTEIPYDVQISLHYNYLKALDRIKAEAHSTPGSVRKY